MRRIAESGEQGRPVTANRSLRQRIAAWWQGHDDSASAEGSPGDAPDYLDLGKPNLKRWCDSRIEVAELLFGPSMITPGGPDAVHALVEPLRLETGHTAVEIGAGLGGITRLVAEETSARVVGIEADPVLAEEAMRRSADAGLKKQAGVSCYSLDTFSLKPRSADAVYAKESFLFVEDKQYLFERIAKILRSQARLTFTDFVLIGPDSRSPEIAIWGAHEAFPIHVIPTDRIESLLDSVGFDLIDRYDMTDVYREAILKAFASAAQTLKAKGSAAAGYAEWLAAEGDMWKRRATVLSTGEVQVQHFHAQVRRVAD